jgi:hypothetical protein
MAINNSSVRITTGAHDDYEWLTTRSETIRTLLRACPEVVLGKYVAITSLDSGPLQLNEDEKSLGWESRRGVAYSPKIQLVEKLPFENYDEWYVFPSAFELGQVTATNVLKAPLRPGEIAVFVNFGGFRVHAPDVPEMEDLIELFWRQLELIHPESYIADGDFLNFVCRNKDLFTTVRKVLT